MDMIFLSQQAVRAKRKRQNRFKRLFQSLQRISLVIFLWLLSIALVYSLYSLLFIQHYFNVERIVVEGELSRLDESTVAEMTAVSLGSNLFGLQMKEIRARIMKNPWVEEVAVRRKLPDALWVYVGEYEPVAIMTGEKLWYVDVKGNLFKEVGPNDRRDYPVLSGISDNTPKEKLLELLDFVRVIDGSVISDYFGVSEYHFDEVEGYSVVTYKSPMLIRFGFEHFPEKLDKFVTILSPMQDVSKKIISVDLNYERKVVVKYATS